MSERKIAPSASALIALLKASLSATGAQAFGHLVLYTSFGVVRGRTGMHLAQEIIDDRNSGAEADSEVEVIELNDVTVEHYSNHLASASFDRLYVRLGDVHGFAIVGGQGQGQG